MIQIISEKPKLRGHFHQAAFFTALGAGSMLVGQVSHSSHRVSIWIYVFTLCLMYGVSAVYHRPNWKPGAREWFRRLDHAAIYLLIAGTTTPLATSTLNSASQKTLLLSMWIAVALGCLKSLFWIRAPKILSALIYLLTGWLTLPYLSTIRSALHGSEMTLLVVGGVAYTLGALVYAIKKPNPFPRSFGYHEVFHLLVVVASFCHFLLIQKIVLDH